MFVADVLKATIAATGLTRHELLGPSKLRCHARPRQVGMYLSNSLVGASKVMIGQIWGGRDYTTVSHAIATIERLLVQGEPEVKELSACVLARLEQQSFASDKALHDARALLHARVVEAERYLARHRAVLAAFDAAIAPGAFQ